MTTREADAEIVHVISDCRLIDAESYERLYWRRDGKGLAPGYYVVRWRADATGHRFNEDAEFEGPFARRENALAALGGETRAMRGRPGAS